MAMVAVDCVLDAKAGTGESAVWDDREQVVWWVDIDVGAIHRFDPADGSDRDWTLPTRIGCLAPRQAGGLVTALQGGFAFFDPASGALERLVDPEADRPGNRFNDGTVDPRGRLVAGTMPLGPRQPVGAMWRFWPDQRCEKLWDDMATAVLGPTHRLLLDEACRLADRLDQIDQLIREGHIALMTEARQQTTALRGIVQELRAAAPKGTGRVGTPPAGPQPGEDGQSGKGMTLDLTARIAAKRAGPPPAG